MRIGSFARDVSINSKEGECVICFDEKPDVSLLCCGATFHFDCLFRMATNGAVSRLLDENRSPDDDPEPECICPHCRAPLP